MMVSFARSMIAMVALCALAACSPQDAAAPHAAPTSAAAQNAPQTAQEVLIGVAGPTSGGIAHVGHDIENGVQVAIDEINATQPVIGGKRVVFKMVSEDDAGDPKQATAVAQRMCDAHVAGVVGHLQSSTSIPASTIYNKCGIAAITPGATSPDLTNSAYNNIFRLIANDGQLGEAVVDFAASKLGVQRVAIIDDRTAYGQGLARVFKQAAAKNAMEVVASEFTNDKASDFMPILTSIKAQNPDAIFFGGLDSQAGPMLRQMQQMGMDKVRFFGGDAVCTEQLPKQASGVPAVNKVICGTGGASIQKMQGGADWFKRYNARFPGQFQIYSPYSYDAARVLMQAMREADSVDPNVYIPKLAAIHFKGLTGDIAFTDRGELQHPAVTIFTFKDGVRLEMP